MKNYIFATLLLFTCIIADASVIGRHLYRDSHTGINTSSFGSSLSNLCSATQTIDSSSCVIEQKSCKPEGSWVSGTYFGYGLYGDSVPVKITYSKQCGETVYPDVIHQKNVSRAELPEPEPDQCQFSPISANPVRISNGSKKYVESDYLSTKEYPVEFRRKYWGKYASVAEHNVGKWHFSHSFSLAHDSTNGIVRLARPNGQFLKFTINDETWSPENKSVKGNLVATEAGWIYTRPEGVEEHYGTDGKINKIRYRSGAETTYTHTEQPFNAGLTYKGDKSVDHGYLVPEKTEITDPYGDTYQVLYNSLGNVSEFVAADGRRWQYSYSTNNPFLLEKVIYPDGTSQQYLYDAEENIIGIVDENGEQVTEVRYDNSGRVTYSALADGVESSSFTYHLNKTEVVNSLGHKTVYHFEDVPSTVGSGKRLTKIEGEDQSSCLQNVKSQTYDSNGYIQTKTTADKGVVETIKDSNGNTTVERTGLKWSSSNTLEEIPGTSKKTEISWHQEFNKPIEQKFYELDKAGVWSHKLTITYIYYDGVDESAQYGKLKQLSKLDVSTGEQRTWQYSYQIDNVSGLTQRKVETDSLNNSTEWIYDHKGRVIEVKNALQHSTIFEYSGINNKPIKVTNVNGSITQLSWDLRGRLVQIQQGSLIQSFEYFANGKVKSITSPSGQKLTYGYDTPGRLTSISDELGNKIEYDYDTESNLVQSRVIDASQSVQFTKSNVYNKLSQLVKLLDHSGNFKQQEFNHVDQLQKIIDGEGNETTFEYDAIGRLLKEVNAEGNPVSYEYDFRDKISSITDQENRTTTYEYNAFGDLVELNSPDTGITTFKYDLAGNLIEKNHNGTITTYAYDSLNRLSRITYHNGDSVNFGYDLFDQNGIGNLSSIETNDSKIEYLYNQYGQIIQQINYINSQQYTIRYEYDDAGRIYLVAMPSGNAQKYNYDLNGRLSSISLVTSSGESILAQDITHKPFGPIESLVLGNGLQNILEYDQSYKLVKNRVEGLRETEYSYDRNNQIVEIIKNVNDKDTYVYDSLNRLDLAMNELNTFDYVYDKIGNRLAKSFEIIDKVAVGTPTKWSLQNTSPEITVSENGLELSAQYTGVYNVYAKASNALPVGKKVYIGEFTLSNSYQSFIGLSTASFNNENSTYNDSLGSTSSAKAKPSIGYLPGYGYLYQHDEVNKIIHYTSRSYANDIISLLVDLESEIHELIIWKNGQEIKRIPIEQGQTWFPTISFRHPSYTYSASANFGSSAFTYTPPEGFIAGLDNASISYVDEPIDNGDVYTYEQSSRLMQISGGSNTTFEYDANGNTTRKGDLFLAYNDANRLSSIAKGSTSATYTYNGKGERVAKVVNGVEAHFIYNHNGQLIAEANGDGVIQKEYIYLNNQPFAQVIGSDVYYYHNSHLGTPELMTDANQNVVWQASYTPFGLATVEVETITNNIRFPGQYFDAESGLHYNYFRDYDPETGRYIESDPIGLEGGVNTYIYTSANPINRIDPNGLKWIPCPPGMSSDPNCKLWVDDDSVGHDLPLRDATGDASAFSKFTNCDCVNKCMDETKNLRRMCMLARKVGVKQICDLIDSIECTQRCKNECGEDSCE